MSSLRDRVLLEGTLQVRNAWTLVLAAVLLVCLVAGSYSTVGWAEAMSPTLESIRQQQGAAFPAWLSSAAEALPFRNDLAALQPRMGVNLYLTIAGAVGPLLAAVWGARAIGSEFGLRTARVRAVNDGWTRVIAGKQIIIVIAALVTAGVVPVLGVIAGQVTWSLLLHRTPGLSGIAVPPLSFSPVLGAMVVAAGTALYGLLGCLAALVTRSTAGGIVIGVATPYIEGFLGFSWLPRAAYGHLLTRWLAYYDGSFIVAPGVAHAPATMTLAVSITGAWFVVLAVSALLLSRRQEIA